jgi:hypothetical protein
VWQDKGPVTAIQRRSLNVDEERVLRLLLKAWVGGDRYIQQIPSLLVTGRCNCGCVTVYFGNEPAGEVHEPEHPLPVEADLLGENGEPIGGVLIFERRGQIRTLEAHWYGDGPILSWPRNQQIIVRMR